MRLCRFPLLGRWPGRLALGLSKRGREPGRSVSARGGRCWLGSGFSRCRRSRRPLDGCAAAGREGASTRGALALRAAAASPALKLGGRHQNQPCGGRVPHGVLRAVGTRGRAAAGGAVRAAAAPARSPRALGRAACGPRRQHGPCGTRGSRCLSPALAGRAPVPGRWKLCACCPGFPQPERALRLLSSFKHGALPLQILYITNAQPSEILMDGRKYPTLSRASCYLISRFRYYFFLYPATSWLQAIT